MQCVAAAEKAYREAGALDKFSFLLQENTAHRVTPAARQAAIGWFVRWLRP